MALGTYTTGTVSIGASATSVVGVGTSWSGVNVRAGDTLLVAGHEVSVVDVVDVTHLTIDPWPYTAVTAGAAYKVTQDSPLRFAGAQNALDVANVLAALNTAGYFVFVDTVSTVPDPSLGNNGQFAFQPSTGKLWTKTGGVWVFTGTYGGAGSPGASFAATSTTSLLISAASKVFTTQAGLAYTVGTRVRATSAANTANYMEGLVTAYSGTSLTVLMSSTHGSGTLADWNINLAGDPGSGDMLSTNNLSELTNATTARGNLAILAAPNGRLTLTSGAPKQASSVNGATQFYYSSAGQYPSYDGTKITMRPYTELTNILANTATGNAGPNVLPSNAICDVYIWDNAGTPVLTRSDWWKKTDVAQITAATPSVCTVVGNDYEDGAPFIPITIGGLTGITAGNTYYVKSTTPGVVANSFNFSTTPGGAAINTGGSTATGINLTASDKTGAIARAASGNCERQFIQGFAWNKNAITNGPAATKGLHVGTIKTNASGTLDFVFGGVASGGLAAKFMVSNVFNREQFKSCCIDSNASGTRTTGAGTWGPTSNGGGTGMKMSCVRCDDTDAVEASYNLAYAVPTAGIAAIGIGLDSIALPNQLIANTAYIASAGNAEARLSGLIGQGSHFIQPIESNPSSTSTQFFGSSGAANSGFHVSIWA